MKRKHNECESFGFLKLNWIEWREEDISVSWLNW